MGLFKLFRNLNLGVKLNAVVVLTLGVLLAIIMVVTGTSIMNLIIQTGQQRVEQEAGLVQSQFAEAVQALLADTESLADTPALAEALVNGDVATINRIVTIGAVTTFHMDDVGVVDATGARVVDIDKVAAVEEDALLALGLLAIENTGVVVVEEDVGGELEFRLAAAVPLFDASGEIAGALVASRAVDDEFLAKINLARTESVHLGLIYGGQILAQDHPEPEAGEFALLLEETPTEHEQALGGQPAIVDHLVYPEAGVPHALAYAPLTVSGETRAAISVLVHYYELSVFRRQLTRNTAIVFSVAALVAVGAIMLFSRRSITVPIGKLRSVAQQMAGGDYAQRAKVTTEDEVGQLAHAFNEMADQLQQTLTRLEQRARELEQRSRELEQRSAYLAASADVGRASASILDVEALIREVVDLIRERFDLYYVGLFLVDEMGEWAVLQAGTGEAGKKMLERGHRLKVGEGMIGWSVAHTEARIALDVGADAVRFDNPDLPETRSEGALPLRSRGQVLGALTVQSREEAAFDQDTLVVLQTMADQVAVALDNAALFAESQAALEAERRAYGEISREAWLQMARTRRDLDVSSDERGVVPAGDEWQLWMETALQTGMTTPGQGGVATVATPIKVRGQTIGVIDAQKPDGTGEWTAKEIALLETLTGQLGQALDSARLYQDTQRRAVREQLTGEVATRLRESLDVETVLKTAAQEVRQALDLPEVIVRLVPQSPDQAKTVFGKGKYGGE